MKFTNISFQKMNLLILLTSLGIAFNACTDNSTPDYPSIAGAIVDKNYQFDTIPTWSDEFSGSSVDMNKWTFEIGANGWGNNELEYYTNGSNAVVSDGTLKIIAKKENMDNAKYTSTRMITRGKGDFTYGRVEGRLKLPIGNGLWPAFWMLASENTYGNWPKSGEIDIMEQVGYDPFKVHFSIHTEAYNHTINTEKTRDTTVNTATQDFHLYRVDWTPYSVKGFVDNKKVFEFANENAGYSKYPFNRNFFIILNLAVGGSWGGTVDDNIFPKTYEIDYVRVYKLLQ